MGIVISTTTLAPFSLATGVIGLVSFGFTVSTFLRVVWVNFETMTEAPNEVHSYLTNLRTELLEEKASIRLMRRQARRYHRAVRRGEARHPEFMGIELDDVALKTMGDVVKHLIRQFREVERPFLEDQPEIDANGRNHGGHHRRTRRKGNYNGGEDEDEDFQYYHRQRHSGAYTQSSPARTNEKGRARGSERSRGRRDREEEAAMEDEEEEDAFWAQRIQYADFTMRKRWAWVRKKGAAQKLFSTLSRVQIRRIARQVGGISLLMHEYGGGVVRSSEALGRMEERMNNIVGIRRVD